MHGLIHTHIFACQPRETRDHDPHKPEAHRPLILVSNIILNKRNQISLKNQLILGPGKEIYKMSLKYIPVTQNRKRSKNSTMIRYVQATQEATERASKGKQ